jgi:FKBP-type peptidyl-prolyl cis-trans isomerase
MTEQTIRTASGLEYVEIATGTGPLPETGDSVSVHYTGWLTNGRKFDSSHDRGQPIVFPLGRGRVIKGWDEGVASMRVGGKRRLIIPASLAYGERGAGGIIPPGATLVFEVELVAINAA